MKRTFFLLLSFVAVLSARGQMSLERQDYFSATQYYLGAEAGIGGSIDACAVGGAFFHGVNVEFRIRVPLGTHEIAYYNLPERDGRSREMKLMPGTGFEFLAGYGIPLSGRFRLTPSAGIGFTPFIGRATDLSMRVQRSYIFFGLGALKAEYALSPSFSLVVTPGYAVPFGRDAFVRNFETTRSAVKSWYSGFFVHLGVHFNFEEK